METYIKCQDDAKSKIQKARVNFKKSPKERVTLPYLETRLETLENYWISYRDTHRAIITEFDSKEIMKSNYYTSEAYGETEELYTDYKTELKAAILKMNMDSSHVQQSDTTINVSRVDQSLTVKLPQISVPTFSGQYTEWTSFHDLFTSLIHNNKGLDDVQRLHYLKSHLIGEAEQLLRHISITASNYKTCWELLLHRYNNRKYLANCILKRFMSQKNILVESSAAVKDLLDTTNECINGLKNLDVDVSSWDVIIIYIVSLKLDTESRKLWEVQISKLTDELPKLSDFLGFLDQRFRSLEFLNNKIIKPVKVHVPKVMHIASVVSCSFCSETHKIINCKRFAKEDVDTRRNFAQTNRLCFNCLGVNHTVHTCRQTTNCRICKRRHHSLLHPKTVHKNDHCSISDQSNGVDLIAAPSSTSQGEGSNIVTCFSNIKSQVLLATALVKVDSKNGTYFLRCLVDQGSQASFITESAVQMLGLNKIPSMSYISGLCGDQSAALQSKCYVTLTIQSRHDYNFTVEVKAHVVKKITSLLPEKKIDFRCFPAQFSIKELADPFFDTPNKSNLLLGAEVYCQILREGIIKGPPGSPIAQNTHLGWILSGHIHPPQNISSEHHDRIVSMHTHTTNDLLRKFWELEMPPSKNERLLSQEEQACEEFFRKTIRRDNSGRYVVKLPFKYEDPKCKYGNSFQISQRRFNSLEKRLINNPEFKIQYAEVIEEYLSLGHMESVPQSEVSSPTAVYLPHHAVINQDKSTTKIRVVFDASCTLDNGSSLNKDMMIGPTLQPDLRHLIMRWRCYPICLVADIEKMYRQIKVSEEDVDFQRLLWRKQSNSELQHLRLLRVTFGTSSAPYLAVRALQQLSHDEGQQFPLVADKVLKDFYMDDLMTGCDSVQEGFQVYRQMNDLLSLGGFKLQKWNSNSEELLNMMQCDLKNSTKGLEFKLDSVIKLLGLRWNRCSDQFQYTVQLPALETPVTKRRVISDIARLFDPLGWIAPVITSAKIFIQRIWLSGVDWDDEIPSDVLKEWIIYRSNLFKLTDFRLPRWVGISKHSVHTELQGFCDASNVAYAAVVYIRTISNEGKIRVHLIASKSRIAPVKQVSIPRLELCGAVLLAKLLQEVSEALSIPRVDVHAWTDSCVVLAWLSNHPCKWKTFVANRVSEVLDTMDSSQWSHVSSEDNPADCASRGVNPGDLAKIELWKHGPKWLQENTVHYRKGNFKDTNIEQKKEKILTHIIIERESIITRFSSLNRLIRVIAYCRRFLNLKDKKGLHIKIKRWLTTKELNDSLLTCIRLCQREGFLEEIEGLKKSEGINKKSKLTSLNPFLDSEGILRVGGRLQQADIVQNMKHPILIPHKTHLSNLIVADAHKRTLHGGPQLMINYLRTRYWIVNAKNLVRQYVRNCVVCSRYAAKTNQQLMGQLPSARVTACRPFYQSGVDYAGPIAIRPTKGRGYHSTKGYICLFICMTTRAIHLEVVSDLTSPAFLAAFKRFVARRGHCADLWSDNGTNFVGANREMKRIFQEGAVVAEDIAAWLASNKTTWHFIPPYSPNFGGLWEAGVKSTKYHLKRVIGNTTLTFEEMTTLLCQIEACLNSRPISQVSNNPEDSFPLTPGHFLVGEPLVLVPDINFENSTVSTLKRWQFAQRLMQVFWRRWSREYLTQLHHRYKWSHVVPEPKAGDIVLVKEDDLPPAKWLYGRITTKHVGSDNLTRVVSLKCKGSIIKRPVSKLIVLPITQ